MNPYDQNHQFDTIDKLFTIFTLIGLGALTGVGLGLGLWIVWFVGSVLSTLIR